jgi:hypothetical protein
MVVLRKDVIRLWHVHCKVCTEYSAPTLEHFNRFTITPTLQRQNAENLKQIFPEKEYRDLSPNFSIHVSVSELYIPRWVCLFGWRKYVDWSWEYINRSKTHECGNWGWGRAIPRKEYINGIAIVVQTPTPLYQRPSADYSQLILIVLRRAFALVSLTID